MSSKAIQMAEQYLLPFEDLPACAQIGETFEKEPLGGVWYERFVIEYVELDGNGAAAVQAADEHIGRKGRTENGAKVWACRVLKKPGVQEGIRAKKAKAALEAGLTLKDFYERVHLMHGQASGLIPVRKTYMSVIEGVHVQHDADVYDPSLPGVGKALEMWGKSLGVFQDNLTIKTDPIAELLKEIDGAGTTIKTIVDSAGDE
jgi:hypothetical protein